MTINPAKQQKINQLTMYIKKLKFEAKKEVEKFKIQIKKASKPVFRKVWNLIVCNYCWQSADSLKCIHCGYPVTRIVNNTKCPKCEKTCNTNICNRCGAKYVKDAAAKLKLRMENYKRSVKAKETEIRKQIQSIRKMP